jgi:hypothetical protein
LLLQQVLWMYPILQQIRTSFLSFSTKKQNQNSSLCFCLRTTGTTRQHCSRLYLASQIIIPKIVHTQRKKVIKKVLWKKDRKQNAINL